MVLFLHKKFLKPIIGGFITGGFEGAIRGGLQGLTGQRPTRVAPRVAADRTFGSFQAAVADQRRPRLPPRQPFPIRPPTPVSFGGFSGFSPARQTFQRQTFQRQTFQQFQPSGREQIIQLVRRFCR